MKYTEMFMKSHPNHRNLMTSSAKVSINRTNG